MDYLVEVNELPKSKTKQCFAIGCFSRGGFEIGLVRKTEKYVYNYFIPSGLLVIVSWVKTKKISWKENYRVKCFEIFYKLQISFVIPPEIVPGRAGVLVTVMLVLVNLFLNITSKSPNTDSLTAISCWMIGCILFVALTLMEYAIILSSKHVLSFKNSHSLKSKIFDLIHSFQCSILECISKVNIKFEF